MHASRTAVAGEATGTSKAVAARPRPGAAKGRGTHGPESAAGVGRGQSTLPSGAAEGGTMWSLSAGVRHMLSASNTSRTPSPAARSRTQPTCAIGGKTPRRAAPPCAGAPPAAAGDAGGSSAASPREGKPSAGSSGCASARPPAAAAVAATAAAAAGSRRARAAAIGAGWTPSHAARGARAGQARPARQRPVRRALRCSEPGRPPLPAPRLSSGGALRLSGGLGAQPRCMKGCEEEGGLGGASVARRQRSHGEMAEQMVAALSLAAQRTPCCGQPASAQSPETP